VVVRRCTIFLAVIYDDDHYDIVMASAPNFRVQRAILRLLSALSIGHERAIIVAVLERDVTDQSVIWRDRVSSTHVAVLDESRVFEIVFPFFLFFVPRARAEIKLRLSRPTCCHVRNLRGSGWKATQIATSLQCCSTCLYWLQMSR